MNLEQITKSLHKLEAAIAVQADALSTSELILVQVLRLLHEQGTLSLQDVIARLQSHAAFAQGAFGHPKQPILQAQIERLQALVTAYSKHGRPGSGPQA